MQLTSYLTFNGNCREAMEFYQQCLGGSLHFQTVGESPLALSLPQPMQHCILHATLTKDSLVLMGSDMVEDRGLVKGNAVSLLLQCNSEEEIQKRYAALSRNGEALHPLASTFWGAVFGGLIDRFGHHWLLHYEKKKQDEPGLATKKL